MKVIHLFFIIFSQVAQSTKTNQSICDKYTKTIFKKLNQENQLKLLTTLVNTVIIGNFTPTVNNKKVKGILGPQEFMGQKFDLTGFFTGNMVKAKTANINGEAKGGINFLDGGGADALKLGKPSNLAVSRQDKLLSHLYQLFGELTGCSKQGGKIFPKYSGNPSMYETHKFMGLNKAKISFFNDMVGQAALGFGVSKEDVKSIGDLLESTFNIQCGLPTKLTPSLDPQSQGFCFGKGCKVGKDRVCLKTLGKTVSNPNLPPCDPSNTSTPPPIAYTSPYTEATTPLSTSNTETTTTETTTTTESISLFAIETQPSEYSTTYSAYPTASPQFDICTNRPYISNIPIFSSGMKVGINALVLFFSVVLVL